MNKQFPTIRIQDFTSRVTQLKYELFELENDLVNFIRIEDLKRKKSNESEKSFVVENEVKFPTRQAISNLKKGPFIDQMDD